MFEINENVSFFNFRTFMFWRHFLVTFLSVLTGLATQGYVNCKQRQKGGKFKTLALIDYQDR